MRKLLNDSKQTKLRQDEPRPRLGYPDDQYETCHDSMERGDCSLDCLTTVELFAEDVCVVETGPLFCEGKENGCAA